MSTASAATAGEGVEIPAVKYRGMITLLVMVSTIMQALDSTIANIALPHMQGALGAANDTINWVLTSYVVASAIFMPMTGWLAARLGRKGLMLLSVAGFTIASIMCGMAVSLSDMVVYRILQGVFGACIVPLGQTIMMDINPPERQAKAMALWGAGVMVGPIMGPTLGGLITEAYNWRWVFFINIPIGIVTCLGIMAFIPEKKIPAQKLNLGGFAILGVGIGALQLMLDRGQHLDWFESPEIMIEAGLVIACAWMFVWHIRFSKSPFLPRALFEDRNFCIGLVLSLISGAMILASVVLLPPMLQNLMGYSTITSGVLLAPRGIGVMVTMLLIGGLLERVDMRWCIVLSACLIILSLYLMTQFSLEMDSTPVVISGIVQGVGMGFMFTSMTRLTFATMNPKFRADGTGMYSLTRSVGHSLGVSGVSTLLAQNMQRYQAELGENVTAFSLEQNQSWIDYMGAFDYEMALGMLEAEIIRQATMMAMLLDYQYLMIMMLFMLPFVFFMRRPPKPVQKPKP